MVLATDHKCDNIAFVFSWRIYRIISGEVLSQKKFQRQVVSIMIRRSASQIIDVRSHPGHTFKVAGEISLDGVEHYPSLALMRRWVICKKIAIILVQNVVKACI